MTSFISMFTNKSQGDNAAARLASGLSETFAEGKNSLEMPYNEISDLTKLLGASAELPLLARAKTTHEAAAAKLEETKENIASGRYKATKAYYLEQAARYVNVAGKFEVFVRSNQSTIRQLQQMPVEDQQKKIQALAGRFKPEVIAVLNFLASSKLEHPTSAGYTPDEFDLMHDGLDDLEIYSEGTALIPKTPGFASPSGAYGSFLN
ncbi:MAG: hypothetical protein JSR39_05975 [Verrucomicrobia bacterium]|nr:hypothetical protein [Verrucomicrobiota bacterium]